MLTGSDIRSKFLSYFEGKGHTVVASSSLVPTNDPTLMFTNSGMVQFKNTFLGAEKRAYVRATSSQRCVRAGGKHNDLENVGHTARHHTFFEMLGNFSFGDYFKEDAITYAWDLLTNHLGLDPKRMCVTVYHEDDEAFDIWHKKIGLSKDDIIRIGDNKGKKYASDNFWTMGDDGPCGPCSEIFYDHGSHIWGGRPGTPEEDGDRWVEIWNMVFMQYMLEGGQVVGKLQQTGIDTGMGLERVMAVCQGVNSNYDTDIFQAIIKKAAELTGKPYGKDEETNVSLRVIADHLRAMSFLMVDGVMPSNEGRGYVLRRIMRRAMRHGHLLGMEKPFIYNLVPALVGVMGEHYQELTRGAQMVMDIIKLEEERFGRTLFQGMKILDEESANLKEGDKLSGAVAFKLYDTYGFPMDLTADALRARGIGVDEAAFETAMEEQRQRARAAGMGGTGQNKLSPVWFDLKDKVGATEFLGYEATAAEGVIQALVQGDKVVNTLKKGDKAVLLVNQTPFYGESGGQVGDTGVVIAEGGKAKVTDTQKAIEGALFQHVIEVTEGTLTVGDAVQLKVDVNRRAQIMRNHSATHLMHAVLREVLGDHVFQKGSLVNEQRTRFDFSHPKAVTAEELKTIEDKVNAMIWANQPVKARLMDKDVAMEAGAMALFGEKYGDEVRVLTMGENGTPFSVELCGGTHVARTGDIGLFKFVAESSVAAGVRRVEAVTGPVAVEYMSGFEKQVKDLSASLKAAPAELEGRIAALQKEVKDLKQQVKDARKGGAAGGGADDLMGKAETVNGVTFIGAEVGDLDANTLREMVDDLKNRMGSGVVVLAAKGEDKASIVVGVTKDLVGKYNAGQIVGIAAEKVGGRGGGRPDMAMAGGKDPAGIADALLAARASVVGSAA
ncbi:MAG: alanine--tRNA ligase [Proteobacteria bacterium]|nr:alanine--tRNA ligase [Pseudomonadota bacterium]